jgi:hypothetical protein
LNPGARDWQHPGLRELREYAEHRGLTIVREYIDRMTGSKDSRPSLNRLMADARVSLSDAIVGLIKMVIISFLLSLGLCVIARPSLLNS